MAELEIDIEDICTRKSWRRNAMNRNSYPNVNYKPIIYQRNGHLNSSVSLSFPPPQDIL